MSTHLFHLNADYQGGLSGQGRIHGQGLEVTFSAPTVLGGKGEGTNPEELLAAAASACFLITFGAVTQFQGIEITGVSNRTEIGATKDGGFHITHVTHFPIVRIPKNGNAEKVRMALERAEAGCLIGLAIKGNVKASVEARIEET